MKDNNTFYITTPIYYPSDKLHIGHTYCTVATDAMARYKRLKGCDVLFLTGTDEHGQKSEDKAREAGMEPKAFVDNIVEGPRGVLDLWKLMDISNDRFIRTTDDYHMESVQKIFKRLYEQGDIYKGKYVGKYCKPCESFWTETQLVADRIRHTVTEHLRICDLIKDYRINPHGYIIDVYKRQESLSVQISSDRT